MKFLAVAVFLVAVAYASASGIGLPVVASRGALEGALGGQWIPDVPVAAPWGAKYAPLAAPWTAPLASHLATPLAGQWAAHVPAPVIAARSIAAPIVPAPLAYGWGAHGVVSKGALEGALGGQWIPDVLPEH